ncbi:MAG: hypothetical protein NTZ10_05595 [Candidatus Saganbacteria bacterium]|nr:hypothetical protein [Candidatus Saganbacteria bacterium]
MYNICLIHPDGYIHAKCFDEIALLLKSSFDSLGIAAEIKENYLNKEKTNIVLGYHLIPFNDGMKEIKYIPYQFEQIGAEGGWDSENQKKLLENAFEIWDYSLENIKRLNERGLKAKYLPVGYHEKLELIPDAGNNKDIDVLFYGSINERRKKVLDELKNINVKVLFGVYGKERDEIIARTRIALSMHFYDAKIFEAPRISYLLNNKCFIVAEESDINPYEKVSFKSFAYEGLADKCRYYLLHANETEKIKATNHKEFKENYPMIELVENVL